MLQFEILGVKIQFKFLFFAVVSVILYTDGSGIAFRAFCAALMHEMGHVICFFLFGQKPELVVFECSGIKMKEDISHNTSVLQELIILSAGCAVNFIVFFLAYSMGSENFAIIHLVLGIFNLLPVLSLDGGKILLLLSSQVMDYSLAYRMIKVMSYVFCAVLIIIGMVFAYSLNFSLLVTSIYLLISLLVEK